MNYRQSVFTMTPLPRPLFFFAVTLGAATAAFCADATIVPTKGSQQFVEVEKDVKLEVVDWGGAGPPLLFLAGQGNDAHVFDRFAPKFTGKHHVYGITRRGFGASSAPSSGYSGDRLGNDVLSVLDALHLERAILVGHSIAGAELSWMSSHHPDRVAGLVYLDAAYAYAYYGDESSDSIKVGIDANELRQRLSDLLPGSGCAHPKQLVGDILKDLPRFERELRQFLESVKDLPEPGEGTPKLPIIHGISSGLQKYTRLQGPILAIFALSDPPAQGAGAEGQAAHNARVISQANALEHGVPSARVVRIPHASHFVFTSNEAEVTQAMDRFLDELPGRDEATRQERRSQP